MFCVGWVVFIRYTVLLEVARDRKWEREEGKAPKADVQQDDDQDSLWGPDRGPFDALLEGSAAVKVPSPGSIVTFEQVLSHVACPLAMCSLALGSRSVSRADSGA